MSEATNDNVNLETLLTFRLASDRYALRVSTVQEVLEYSEPTRIPGTSKVLAGVINVRGRVIPVVDLRHRLGLPEADRSVETGIVVTEMQTGDEVAIVGLIVDAVEGVNEIESGRIEAAPRLGTAVSAEDVEGIVNTEEGFTLLLRTERLVTAEAVRALHRVEHTPVQSSSGE